MSFAYAYDKGGKFMSRFAQGLPTAILITFISVPEKIVEAMGNEVPTLMDISAGEKKEYYFGLFLMIYAWSLWLRREPGAEAASA